MLSNAKKTVKSRLTSFARANFVGHYFCLRLELGLGSAGAEGLCRNLKEIEEVVSVDRQIDKGN